MLESTKLENNKTLENNIVEATRTATTIMGINILTLTDITAEPPY